MLNIDARANVVLSYDNLDTELRAIGDYQFFNYMIIKPRVSHVASDTLCTINWTWWEGISCLCVILGKEVKVLYCVVNYEIFFLL